MEVLLLLGKTYDKQASLLLLLLLLLSHLNKLFMFSCRLDFSSFIILQESRAVLVTLS